MRWVLAVAVCGLVCLAGCGGSSGVPAGDTTTAPILPPTAKVGGPYTGTAGTAVSFTGTGSSDPQSQVLTYAWAFGDGGTATGATPTHIYPQVAGATQSVYTVSLTVTDSSGFSGQASTTATIQDATPLSDVALTGVVETGQKAIVGAHVYLLAAAATGYGLPSISLESAAETGVSDTVGAYVVTGASGAFSLTGDYTCTSGQQLYIYTLGGNAGAGANSAAGLLAAIGPCPGSSNTGIVVHVNEVSTVAAAFAFSSFAVDATHVSSSATTLGQLGIANAFANAANLATLSTGVALATTPAGNGTAPQAEINSLANNLSACVDLSNPASSCAVLFSNVAAGGVTGAAPTDTATAAIYIAHNPWANTTSIYLVTPNSPPYTPALSAAPSDFSMAISFAGGGLNSPEGIAIDGAGDAWVSNYAGNSVTKLSNVGATLSGTGGYTGGGLNNPGGIAIDGSGNAWIANYGGNSVTEMSSTGSPVSGSKGYTVGGLSQPRGIAIDGSGNAWIANAGSVSKLNSAGVAASGSPYTGGGVSLPQGIAIDGSGNAWIANGSNSVSELSSSGSAATGSPFTGGGLLTPVAVALDSSGNAWISDNTNASVTKLSQSGAILSGTKGYTGGGLNSPFAVAIDGSGNVWVANQNPFGISGFSGTGVSLAGPSGYFSSGLNQPTGIAVDGSGDVWIANNGNNSVSEFVGIAMPVVTPIAAGLPATATANGSSKLGTEP